MLEYCVCPKCARMIMLDSDMASGFCLYCGTHIAYDEAREELLSGLRASVPAELSIEADLSGLIDDDDAPEEDTRGLAECREECAKAQELFRKWDFSKAFEGFQSALSYYPNDFESRCGLLTSGILKLKDTENWERWLKDCTAVIRSQSDWSMAQSSIEYALEIVKKFFSRGGRFVSEYYTRGFFTRLMESFPPLRTLASEILAHCINVDCAPLYSAARLDGETTRFAVGSYPPEPDKDLRLSYLPVLRYHPDERVKEALCRAIYVYDREIWLRTVDEGRINDAISLCESVSDGSFRPKASEMVTGVIYDFLMMGALEQSTTALEKRLFLSRVYTIEQMRRMDRFFGSDLFFCRLYSDIYLAQKNADATSAEYRRIQQRLRTLTD